jgi:hypothetical protein
MNELFGDDGTPQGGAAKFTVTKPALKTSRKTAVPGSGKSVKFYEEEVKHSEKRGAGQLVGNGI